MMRTSATNNEGNAIFRFKFRFNSGFDEIGLLYRVKEAKYG